VSDNRLPFITPHLVTLTECVCEELAATGAGPTCWCGMYAGALPAWDYCGSCDGDVCGMGYVRVVTAFPYEVFPIPTLDNTCRRELAWQIEVGAMRCIPVHDDGLPLAEADMAEVWVGQMLDTWALYKALTCCEAPGMSVQSYTPVGPEGGCVGGFWTAYVSM
jgi:hypothetical protein